jgi:uncharacterized membrane protein YhaH (DUF805 family)
VGMSEAVRTVLSKYVDFSGRARRSEYWYWILAVLIVDVVVTIIDLALDTGVLALLLTLATFLPSLAVSVRRLHDIGRSGWWLLIGLVPLVGAILLLVWACSDSEPKTNAWGPSPKGGVAPGDYGQVSYGQPPVG